MILDSLLIAVALAGPPPVPPAGATPNGAVPERPMPSGKSTDKVADVIRSMTPAQRRALIEQFRAGEPLDDVRARAARKLVELGTNRADSSLTYRSGTIEFGNGLGVAKLGDQFRFLGPTDARRVMEQGWGNPPENAVLGMIVPADVSPMNIKRGWGVVLTYLADGHVDDGGGDLDGDALLGRVRKLAEKASRRREADGFSPLELVGWARPPTYDEQRRVLTWAQHVRMGNDETLNYSMRVLGRAGVISLDAAARMDHLDELEPRFDAIAKAVSFTKGNRYEDFTDGKDLEANYDLSGLVLGKRGTRTGSAWTSPGTLAGLFGLVALSGVFFAARRRRGQPGPAPTGGMT